MTVADRVLGVLVAIVVGSVLAVGVAILLSPLSPLSPLGPIRDVYHPPGIDLDWTVLGLGLLVLILGLGAWVGIRQWGKADPRRRPDMCQGC
jgi:hypothetical protein